MNNLYLLYVFPVSLSYCRLGFCTCFNFCNFNFKYSEFVTFYICKETECVYCHPSLMPVFCFCNVKYRCFPGIYSRCSKLCSIQGMGYHSRV